MSYYPALKQRLTCREVAPRYGLKVNASGMALWSDSDSNFSAKLSDQTLRYREVLELADVLGYEIVRQKRRKD